MKTRRNGIGFLASLIAAALACLLLAACGSDGDSGPAGESAPLPPTPTDLGPADDPPGVEVSIVELRGASGPNGSFAPGDRITVVFTVRKRDGTAWRLSEMSSGSILASGPTFNYQRVIAQQSDLIAASTQVGEGRYQYRFSVPIPATYLPPLNDSDAFGPDDGELTGQPLLAGTYTVGMFLSWSYTVRGESFRDAGNAVADFRIGGGSAFEPRAVVSQANCNQCHADLRAHGGSRKDVRLCVLCHTSGAEDKNEPTVEGGTPGVSIDFRVMIHRIHNGKHLPSVLGVTTNPDGTRDYTATPRPYRIIGFRNSVNDFSHAGFPVWPNLTIPMPRDAGHSTLPSAHQAIEDEIRRGVTDCAKCHGDPDGAGPLEAPAQGGVAYSQPTRRACGSCHDDVVWSHRYRSNGETMPENVSDASCLLCHTASGSSLSARDAHVHPLRDPAINPGLHFTITSVSEGGAANGDGDIDPGEKILITFTITDDSGTPVAPSRLSSLNAVISGPVQNRTLLHNGSIPLAGVTGEPPFTIAVPRAISLEFCGFSSDAAGEQFASGLTPHWNVSGATTSVLVTTGFGEGASVLVSSTRALDNFVDVLDTTGFARDDYVVIESGGAGLEYARISLVDGSRLWLTPPLRRSHTSGVSVEEVALRTLSAGSDYALDAPLGRITELREFGAGSAVLMSYTTDFVMPSTYGPPLNDSPDLDETWGEWTGKPLVAGTYTIGLYGARSLTVTQAGENTSYTAAAPPSTRSFRVGTPGLLERSTVVSSGENCNACHNDVLFHGGGRRGFDTCILCHGVSGSEDRARYTAANAPPTTGVTIDYRTMLHKIHMGHELAQGAAYVVNGFGAAAYPNNFTPHTYDEVVFPRMPGGVKQCEACHGTGNTAWQAPSVRDHPTDQAWPAQVWRSSCGACHDSVAAQAHIQSQTAPSGAESCEVCHGRNSEFAVRVMHKPR